jgi:hypothetical protein
VDVGPILFEGEDKYENDVICFITNEKHSIVGNLHFPSSTATSKICTAPVTDTMNSSLNTRVRDNINTMNSPYGYISYDDLPPYLTMPPIMVQAKQSSSIYTDEDIPSLQVLFHLFYSYFCIL